MFETNAQVTRKHQLPEHLDKNIVKILINMSETKHMNLQ